MDAAFLRAVWASGLARILVFLFFYSFAVATLFPLVPTLLTNFFASVRAHGEDIDCESFGRGQAPAACQNAHSDVVVWSSWTSFVSNTLVAFLFLPLVGRLSDSYGRKSFIILAVSLTLLPVGVVLAHLQCHLPLYWYFPALVLGSLVSSIPLCIAYAADRLSPAHRTPGFGLIIAAFSVGFMIGPVVGSYAAPVQAAWMCFGTIVACLVFCFLFVPESRLPVDGAAAAGSGAADGEAAPLLPPAAELGGGAAELGGATAAEGGAPPPLPPPSLHPLMGFLTTWRVINKNPLFRRLAFVLAISGMVSEGISDLLIQYLQLKVGFTTADQGAYFMTAGGCNLVVQAVLLSWLTARLGEKRLLLVGISFSCLQQLAYAFVTARWQVFAAVSMGSLGGMAWPAIASIKSTHSSPEEQGAVQGALAGVRSLAMGVGPLLFARLFRATTSTDSGLPFCPGAVFFLSCALTAVAAGIAATIAWSSSGGSGGGGAGGKQGTKAKKGAAGAEGEENTGEEGAGASGSGGDALREPLLAAGEV